MRRILKSMVTESDKKAVIDLYNRGYSPTSISMGTGMSRYHVQTILANYDGKLTPEARETLAQSIAAHNRIGEAILKEPAIWNVSEVEIVHKNEGQLRPRDWFHMPVSY